MADVIPFSTEPDKIDDGEDVSNDSFLLSEGLDLLADFRAIDDRDVRNSIRQLVKSMARSARSIAGSR